MKLLKNIRPLTKQESENIKGGYVFTCEEKKRNVMTIVAFDDQGNKIQDYKIATTDAMVFMQNYQGNNKQ